MDRDEILYYINLLKEEIKQNNDIIDELLNSFEEE